MLCLCLCVCVCLYGVCERKRLRLCVCVFIFRVLFSFIIPFYVCRCLVFDSRTYAVQWHMCFYMLICVCVCVCEIAGGSPSLWGLPMERVGVGCAKELGNGQQ